MKKKLVLFLAILGVAGIVLSGCGGESQYDKDFQNGMDKYRNGEKMTEGEYNAVKDYQKWESKQGEKTFDEWDN